MTDSATIPHNPENAAHAIRERAPDGRKVPLARLIAQDLAEQIASGALAPGEKLPWRDEMCRKYGVSSITIRGALAELTARGLLESRRRGGIFVRVASPRPAGSTTDTIAMVAEFASSTLCSHILAGASAAAHRAGLNITLAATIDDPEIEANYLEELADKVGGLIVIPVNHTESHFEAFERLVARNRNIVFVDHYIEGIDTPRVTSDNIHGGYLATRSLIDAGCRRVYTVNSGKHTTSSRERLQGYIQAMQEHGFLFDPSLMRHSSHKHIIAGRELCRQILAHRVPGERIGIFAINDLLAAGCYTAVKEAGLRVPDDVAVAGYDDLHGAVMAPPLTSVRQDLQRLGELAVETLIKLEHGERLPPQTVPVELIVRQSTPVATRS